MKDLINKLPEIYQDIVFNGKLLAKGRRECQKRWDIIKGSINPHDVIMDLGSATGYFAQKIAHEYPDSLVISFESDPVMCEVQKQIFEKEGIYNVIVCNHRLTKDDLVNWCHYVEFFDVVLALSVLHHFPPNEAETAFNNIRMMSNWTIGEIPVKSEKDCGQESKEVIRKSMGRTVMLGKVDSHLGKHKREIWAEENKGERIGLDAFFGVDHPDRHRFNVDSNKLNGRHIIKGANVWNLLHFNIVWPNPKWWQNQATRAYKSLEFKSDVRPWNLLVTSTGLTAIDYMTRFSRGDPAEFKSIKDYGDKSDINKLNRLFSKMKPEWR